MEGSFEGTFSSGPGKALEKTLQWAPQDRLYIEFFLTLRVQLVCKVLVVSQG